MPWSAPAAVGGASLDALQRRASDVMLSWFLYLYHTYQCGSGCGQARQPELQFWAVHTLHFHQVFYQVAQMFWVQLVGVVKHQQTACPALAEELQHLGHPVIL